MTGLQIFHYESSEIRTVMKDGQPWWVVKDVCDILGLTNPTVAIQNLDDDERAKLDLGRQGTTNIINESGLYTLIVRSDKPVARKFRKWVTSEVLPSVRKTGSYSVNPSAPQLNHHEEYREALKTAEAIGLRGNQAMLAANNAVRNVHGKNLLALMEMTHLVAEKQIRHFTPTELGQRKKMSGQKFNQLLQAAGLQVKMGDVWMPTDAGREFAVLMDTGKKHNGGTPVQQLKWLDSVMERV